MCVSECVLTSTIWTYVALYWENYWWRGVSGRDASHNTVYTWNKQVRRDALGVICTYLKKIGFFFTFSPYWFSIFWRDYRHNSTYSTYTFTKWLYLKAIALFVSMCLCETSQKVKFKCEFTITNCAAFGCV